MMIIITLIYVTLWLRRQRHRKQWNGRWKV